MLTSCRCMIILLMGLAITEIAVSQTFQYSRGWTNGKRSYRTEPDIEELQEDVFGTRLLHEPLGKVSVNLNEEDLGELVPRLPIRRPRLSHRNAVTTIEKRLKTLELQFQKWLNPDTTADSVRPSVN